MTQSEAISILREALRLVDESDPLSPLHIYVLDSARQALDALKNVEKVNASAGCVKSESSTVSDSEAEKLAQDWVAEFARQIPGSFDYSEAIHCFKAGFCASKRISDVENAFLQREIRELELAFEAKPTTGTGLMALMEETTEARKRVLSNLVNQEIEKRWPSEAWFVAMAREEAFKIAPETNPNSKDLAFIKILYSRLRDRLLGGAK